MKIKLAAPLTKDSIVDGPGLRAVVWTQGCPHSCPECHNPQTHSYDGGFEIEVNEICKQILQLKLHKGVTFSGGEPLEQAAACVNIAKVAKEKGMDVWVFTGYTFENILQKATQQKPEWMELLKLTDVIVDGPYMAQRRNLLLKYRGSENQRVINVQKSLIEEKIVLVEL